MQLIPHKPYLTYSTRSYCTHCTLQSECHPLPLYSLTRSLTDTPKQGEIMGKLYNGIKKLMEREAMVGTPAEKEAEEADTKVRTW
jgi:hypothetical protein